MPDIESKLTYAITLLAPRRVKHLPDKRAEDIIRTQSLGDRKALLEKYPHVLSEYIVSENTPTIAYTFRTTDGALLHIETDPYTDGVRSADRRDIVDIVEVVAGKKSGTLSLALAVPRCPYMPLYIKGVTPDT